MQGKQHPVGDHRAAWTRQPLPAANVLQIFVPWLGKDFSRDRSIFPWKDLVQRAGSAGCRIKLSTQRQNKNKLTICSASGRETIKNWLDEIIHLGEQAGLNMADLGIPKWVTEPDEAGMPPASSASSAPQRSVPAGPLAEPAAVSADAPSMSVTPAASAPQDAEVPQRSVPAVLPAEIAVVSAASAPQAAEAPQRSAPPVTEVSAASAAAASAAEPSPKIHWVDIADYDREMQQSPVDHVILITTLGYTLAHHLNTYNAEAAEALQHRIDPVEDHDLNRLFADWPHNPLLINATGWESVGGAAANHLGSLSAHLQAVPTALFFAQVTEINIASLICARMVTILI